MNRHSFSVFLVLALAFLLSSITVSAQQARAVPPNDNFINAQAITVGKNYKVPDIGAATNEIGEQTASCRGGVAIPNSVWFKLTLPEFAYVLLSTFGSVLTTSEFENNDTVLAVYRLTDTATLIQVACNDSANGVEAAQIVFAVNGEATYYVAVGTYDDSSFLPTSTLKLSTRILATPISPVNFSFETPVDGTDWILKDGSDDTNVCNDVIYVAYAAPCAFRFIGTPGVTTKLAQTTPFPSAFRARKNAQLAVTFYVRVVDTGILDNSRAKIVIRYTDGTPPTTKTIDLTGLAATSDYLEQRTLMGLKSGKVASIKFQIKFGAEDGVLLLDELVFYYNADPGTRGSGLLPVPQAAGETQ